MRTGTGDGMRQPVRPRVGVLLVGCPRYRKLGADTERGEYDARKKQFAEGFLRDLGEIAEPVYPGIVYEREDVQRAIRHFLENTVDCIVCTFLSWSQDYAWVRFLRDVYDVPLLSYVPTLSRAEYDDTRDEDDFIQFLSNGGLVGSLVGSGSVPRLSRTAEVLVGAFASVKERISSFARAAHARARLRGARFGLVANYNELMWSTYIDPYNMFARIGPELHFISYAELKHETDAVSDEAAAAYVRELSDRYTVEPDVAPELFLESARASLALANMREGHGLDALVLNDVDHELFETIGLRPGFYHESFGANDAVLVPEGDLGAGTIVYALKRMTGAQVNFAEPFYVEEATNSFAAGHAGPNDHTDDSVRELVRVSRDVRFAKTSFRFAGAPFAWYRIAPGPKTFAHFSEVDGAYKIVSFTAESLPGKHQLCSYSHSDFRPAGSVTALFERVISVGTTQHFAVVDGDARADLARLARLSGFAFHDLDREGQTT